MKFALLAAASFLHVWSSEAFVSEDAAPSVRIHPRALGKRDGRDCGKFVMFCEKAAAACNNACYHINCIDKTSAIMVYDAGNTNKKNRLQSGCETPDGSVCNAMPFSQKLHDPLNSSPGDRTINCDEWPMATVKQADFQEGTYRNSLRCIPSSENSSGGAQLQTFIAGTNKQGPKKTCDGDVQDGDHWTVDFDYTNTEDVKVQHCKKPDECPNDPYAFHMTKMNGHLSFPYNVDKDNHYALGKTEPELLQCSVVVKLHDNEVKATVYDVKKEQKGSGEGRFTHKEDTITVKGLPLDLAIKYQADDKNPVAFDYGAAAFQSTNLMKTFFWESNQRGSSTQEDGRYCKIEAKGDTKNIECHFPCVAAGE